MINIFGGSCYWKYDYQYDITHTRDYMPSFLVDGNRTVSFRLTL